MPSTIAASDGPTVTLSFANNFWGKDDAGVDPLLGRMQNAKTTGDELRSFYSTRAQIEEDYAKKLLNLARRPLGSVESGTLRMSLDVVRGEVETMGKEHMTIAGKMKSELDEPLAAFAGGMKERRKIVQNGIEKLLKVKMQQTIAVNKTRDRFEQDCLKIKGYLAQGHMVMGQEERKNKAKLEKTQIQMSTNSSEYEAAVKVLEETTGKWNREWKAACDKFQDLEEERLDFFKSSLWTFANVASTVCVSDDASCEKIRLSLEDCEVEKDIMSFIKDNGTGQDIPDPPKYINFCRGDIDDNGSQHGSEDDFSVAQFQRTTNPAFRSSSPQPSTLSAHNDPDSDLREEMGLPRGRSSMQVDEPFNPRDSQGSAHVPPLNASQLSQNSARIPPLSASQVSHRSVKQPTPELYNEIPQVPHNPYPTDGMTQFCRMGPPSDRSSIPSPMRPGSRDSQEDRSDYSAPTSISSAEPSHVSSSKNYNGSGLSAVSSSDEKTLQKRRNGFFSNSPFRRRSQKNKDQQGPVVVPKLATRNTWTPANGRGPETTSPTKPFALASRPGSSRQLAPASPDPDIDPRAEYQLGIGDNVFDVAHPNAQKSTPKKDASDFDPIAQALAELKGVTKQATFRESADRHYGMSTPVPGSNDNRSRANVSPFASNSNHSGPPPAYDSPPVSRLGAPKPAHTSREMRKTTEQYVNQKRDVFNNNGVQPHTTNNTTERPRDMPRSSSPLPRAASPRPYNNTDPRQQSTYRSTSPNPYIAAQPNNRPRAQSSTPVKPQFQQQTPAQNRPQPQHQHSHSAGYASRGGSPGYQAPRAASPNPAYSRPNQNSQPPGSRGSDNGASMALQLAPAGPQDDYHQQRSGRPQSQYHGRDGGAAGQHGDPRARSQSVGMHRQFTKDGRAILHYARAMYMYAAAIPEELSFAKGDVLAVFRHQDDGWWEAEVCGKTSGPGLVPSNYLKNC